MRTPLVRRLDDRAAPARRPTQLSFDFGDAGAAAARPDRRRGARAAVVTLIRPAVPGQGAPGEEAEGDGVQLTLF